MENEKYLCVYTDGSENPLSYCVEDIHGNFIVYDNESSESKSLEPFDYLPERFGYFLYISKNNLDEMGLKSLDLYHIDFLSIIKRSEEIDKIKFEFVDRFSELWTLYKHKWEIQSIDPCSITLKIQLAYVSGDEIDESQTKVPLPLKEAHLLKKQK